MPGRVSDTIGRQFDPGRLAGVQDELKGITLTKQGMKCFKEYRLCLNILPIYHIADGDYF